MIFKNKFIKAGRILCRNRVLLPIIYVGIIVLYILMNPPFIFSDSSLWNDIFSGLVLLLSFRIRWAAENRDSNTLQSVVDAKGIYSVIRFPYYLSDFLMMLGITIYVGSSSLIFVFVLISIIIIERMLMFEEGISFNKLGDVYVKWYRSTNAIIPIIWNWTGAVYTKNIVRKLILMLKPLLFTLFTLNLIHILKGYRLNFAFEVDYFLIVLFLIALFGYISTLVVGRR